jgi:hypothetical protein
MKKNNAFQLRVQKMLPCQTVENDPFHLLLEIERNFRAEERMNLASKRGQSHQNLLKIIKDSSEDQLEEEYVRTSIQGATKDQDSSQGHG